MSTAAEKAAEKAAATAAEKAVAKVTKLYPVESRFTFSRSGTEVEVCKVNDDGTVDLQEVSAPIDPMTKAVLPKRWWGGVAADEKTLLPPPTEK